MSIIVCYSRCWACQFGDHYDPPQWHAWADDEDLAHATTTGRDDPSSQPCACSCARVEVTP